MKNRETLHDEDKSRINKQINIDKRFIVCYDIYQSIDPDVVSISI